MVQIFQVYGMFRGRADGCLEFIDYFLSDVITLSATIVADTNYEIHGTFTKGIRTVVKIVVFCRLRVATRRMTLMFIHV